MKEDLRVKIDSLNNEVNSDVVENNDNDHNSDILDGKENNLDVDNSNYEENYENIEDDINGQEDIAEIDESDNLDIKEDYSNVDNKRRVLKFIILYLFIVIVFLIMFIIFSDIKDKSLSLKNQIDVLLDGSTIDEKREYIDNLNKEIDGGDNVLNEYDSSEIDIEIGDLTKKNEELNNSVNSKQSELDRKKNEYQSLYKKYMDMSTVLVSNIITFNQYPNYPNGCEAVALYILLRHYNVNVSVDSVMDSLPTGRVPYMVDGIWRGGDPNYEFLGDPRSVDGWGIYDQGLAYTANKFKSGIINGTGMDFSQIINLIDNGRPVIVWTSIDLADPYVANSWISDRTGETIYWKRYNHAVVVIGYNEDSIVVSDPINGQIRYFDKQKFINVYDFMGRRALYY